MAFNLTTTARLLSQQTNIQQQLILEIEGIDLIFGAIEITKLWRIGDEGVTIGQSGLLIGGTIPDEKGRPYISLQGTTNNISQQLEIDRGGSGSVTKMNINLIDKDQELTQVFQPGNIVSDLLGREANVFLSFGGAAHPEDSIRIFNGIITSQKASPGSWTVGIDSPQFGTRTDIYPQITTSLSSAISDSATTIPLTSTVGLVEPADVQRSFVRINDELIEYTGISGNDLTGASRGSLTTVASSHALDDEVQSYYTFEDNGYDL